MSQIFKIRSYILFYFTVLSLILTGSLGSILRLCHVNIRDSGYLIERDKVRDSSDTDKEQSKLRKPKAKGWHKPIPAILIKSLNGYY